MGPLKEQQVLERTNRLLSFTQHGHIENDVSNNSSIVARVFVTAVTFLPSRCLTTMGRFLPSRCLAMIGSIYTHSQQRNLISLLYCFKIRNVD
jgi:hypothetical protein